MSGARSLLGGSLGASHQIRVSLDIQVAHGEGLQGGTATNSRRRSDKVAALHGLELILELADTLIASLASLLSARYR